MNAFAKKFSGEMWCICQNFHEVSERYQKHKKLEIARGRVWSWTGPAGFTCSPRPFHSKSSPSPPISSLTSTPLFLSLSLSNRSWPDFIHQCQVNIHSLRNLPKNSLFHFSLFIQKIRFPYFFKNLILEISLTFVKFKEFPFINLGFCYLIVSI